MFVRMLNDFAPVMRMQNEYGLFEDFFDVSPAQRSYSGSYPSLNTWADGDCVFVEAELPGLGMNEIEVVVNGKDLTINGERKLAGEPDAAYYRRERATGQFSRTMLLPWEIDADQVEAKLLDGVLTVKLPKSEACKPKKVKLLTA